MRHAAELVNPAYDSDREYGKRRGKETRIKGCCVAKEKEELREHWERETLWTFKGMILSGILFFSREINYAPKRGMTFKVCHRPFEENS